MRASITLSEATLTSQLPLDSLTPVLIELTIANLDTCDSDYI